MNKRANLYFAALLGAMSPLSTVTALAAQSNSAIATATQQQNSCKGTVKDASGEPIIGATIRIDGKTGGTVTDLDGNFVLNNLAKGAKLTITYVGYKSQTITWNGTPLDITLQDDANVLEETVVIGYGTVKKAPSSHHREYLGRLRQVPRHRGSDGLWKPYLYRTSKVGNSSRSY